MELRQKKDTYPGMLLTVLFIMVFLVNLVFLKSTISPEIANAQSEPGMSCQLKKMGDANCDGKVDESDYKIWARQYDKIVHPKPIENNGNFMCIEGNNTTYFADLIDYEIWRRNTVSGLK